ncbi:MAG: S8 family serine peptidase [Bryobacterales bacterium]|nr:S8 family serine peptidase [Bryobacterales bacterium]
MAGTEYFWQGGRKIEIERDDAQVTIHADTEAEAREAADRAGLQLGMAATAAPGLVQAEIVGDRDAGMARLRGQRHIVHHVYRQQEAPSNEFLITDTFFLKFKAETPDQRVLDYLAAEHLEVVQQMGDLTYLVRVTNETGRNPIRAANAAASRDDVEYAEPNLVRQVTRFFIPADTLFSQQWHLHAPAAAPDLEPGAGIFAPEAWDITFGRREIVVAVADDGFDLTHPDFQGAGKVVASLNATITSGPGGTIQWDADVSPRPGDYHGTPCLGVAVAEGNGTGVVGVAAGCALVAVRFPLSMSDAHFITMFRKISALADVVSCSWGVGPANAPMSTAMRDEISTLARTGGRRGKGLIFCIAAGNNNCPVQDLANTRTYRFRTRFGIQSYSGPIDRWIAAHPDAIVVSGCTSRKTRSAYSSWGRQISVCAPTDNWDDLGQFTPPGLGITTTDNEGAGPGSDFTPGSRFTSDFGGTSSATPTVAGLCGLVLSANAALTALEVKDLLQRSADKDLSLVTDSPVNEPGNFDAQGFSLWFGHGKINAAKAVREAADRAAAVPMVDSMAEPALAIPDRGAPVVSLMQIAASGTIEELRVQVNITHTYIGDLRVDLIAPDSTGVVLHSNRGGSADNIVKTYATEEFTPLRSLLGKPIQGTWRLRIVDTFRLDVGILNSWRLIARVSGNASPASRSAAKPKKASSAKKSTSRRSS